MNEACARDNNQLPGVMVAHGKRRVNDDGATLAEVYQISAYRSGHEDPVLTSLHAQSSTKIAKRQNQEPCYIQGPDYRLGRF